MVTYSPLAPVLFIWSNNSILYSLIHYSSTFPTVPPHSTYTPFPPFQLTTRPPFPAHLPPKDKKMPPKWQRSSTRQTGQTRVTNSQAATYEGWMVRCSPRAPGFSRSNQHSNKGPGNFKVRPNHKVLKRMDAD